MPESIPLNHHPFTHTLAVCYSFDQPGLPFVNVSFVICFSISYLVLYFVWCNFCECCIMDNVRINCAFCFAILRTWFTVLFYVFFASGLIYVDVHIIYHPFWSSNLSYKLICQFLLQL